VTTCCPVNQKATHRQMAPGMEGTMRAGQLTLTYWVRRELAALIVTIGLAACGSTETTNRAATFASAGIEFTDSVPTFYDQSFEAAVVAGSIVLEKNRPLLSAAERRKALHEQDEGLEGLRERYETLAALKQHALLLRTYFIALKGLVDSDDAPGITDSTKSIVNRIVSIKPAIKDLSILGTSVESVIAPAVRIVVGAYKASALRREFEERGATIERELALQTAVLSLLRDQAAADLELQIEFDERRPLENAYVSPANPSVGLPATWRQQRIAMFRRGAILPAADRATKAAETLHQSWISLVRGTAGGPSLAVLIKDIEEFISLVDSARAK
jgi:hypothetical protein